MAVSEGANRSAKRRVAARLALARVVLTFERLAPVVAPFAVALLALVALALWGVFEGASRTWTLAMLGVLTIGALAGAVLNAIRFRPPGRDEARRRVEADSGLPFGTLATLDDAPAAGDAGLWALHQRRMGEAAKRARVAPPRLGLAAADPFALRWAFALMIGLGLWNQGLDGLSRFGDAFRVGPAAVAPALAAPGAIYEDPAARALAEAAAVIRSEQAAYAASPFGDAPSWYGAFDGLTRAPAGVQAAAATLADLGAVEIDPGARVGLGWAQRRIASAGSLREAKAVAAELDAMARRIEHDERAVVRADRTAPDPAWRG